MGWQPGPDGGTDASPDPGSGLPGGASPARDPRLAWFASVEGRDAVVPSGRLALAADQVSGRERRCAGATADELTGLLRGWAAVESWAASAKLGVLAELVRRDEGPREGSGWHGDLPDAWSASLRYETALALACSTQSAQTSIWLAWELRARLPGIGALLNDGTLTFPKARAVIETFKYLTDADATAAEALILGQLAGKTYTQVLRLAEQAALTVDPGLAERRRTETQKQARVTLFRELSGTAGLSGRDLPPDEALAAMAAVNARAQEYEDSGAFGDAPMDALRAYAYLDLLTGTPAEERIATAQAQDEATEVAEALAWANARAARSAAQARSGHEPETGTEPEAGTGTTGAAGTPYNPADGSSSGSANGRDDGMPDEPDNGTPGGDLGDGDDPGNGDDDGDSGGGGDDGGPGPGGPSAGPGAPLAPRALEGRPVDLIVPLATLLGLAEKPGEVQGFGLLDPALARDMAATAAASPRTRVCVTVTSPEGYAIGHGCAHPNRSAYPPQAAAPAGVPGAGLPARLNLTVPVTALASLADGVRLASSSGPWAFAAQAGPGPPSGADPPDGYGTRTLVIPGGRRFIVRLEIVPTLECDHRYETRGYHPSGKLRHLVQVRDGTCTFPSCNRHAHESDFEHAIPFEKSGRTCACNAGSRSRACHRVKQTKNWQVTQPRPGWHQWRTPSGRVYVQEPKRYPA